MKNVLVVAPHPDDETLGCGGTLLRHRAENDQVFWLIMTSMMPNMNFSDDVILKRKIEISTVAEMYAFSEVVQLDFPAARLDMFPIGDIVARVSDAILKIKPEIIYLPFHGDIHTDHIITHQAVVACCKIFRYPFIRKVLAYEILSETEVGASLGKKVFNPNTYINIGKYIDEKIRIAHIYESEMGNFPFPRSETAIKSLATIRGTVSGFAAAEAFELLRETI